MRVFRSKVADGTARALAKRPHTAQLSASLAAASALWLWLLARARGEHVLPPLTAALSQGVALVSALDLHSALRAQLGVRPALPQLLTLVAALGHALSTLAQLPLLGTAVGRVFFAFNALILAVHVHMAYLTLAYNWRLAPRAQRFESLTARSLAASSSASSRPRVNLAALSAWVTLQAAVLRVWLTEGRASTSSWREALAALGFLLQSLASVRAGLSAALTSRAALPTLDGALSLAAAHALAGLSLLPLRSAPIARIFLAGYASTLYSALLNAFYAYRQERERDRARVPYRLHRAKL